MAGLKDYLNKRKQSKLYKQWVQQSQLPAEEIPVEISNVQKGSTPTKSADTENQDIPYSMGGGMITFPVKYLILMLLFIAVLLVVLSVVTTLLVSGS